MISKKIWPLGALVLSLAGCVSHPDYLKVTLVGADVVAYSAFNSHGHYRNTAGLTLTFDGQAPFAAIHQAGDYSGVDCHVLDAAGHRLAELEDGGIVYFDGPVVAPAPSVQQKLDLAQSEYYRYTVLAFPGLQVPKAKNVRARFDLLRENYAAIACNVVGSNVFSRSVSNDMVVSRAQILKLSSKYRAEHANDAPALDPGQSCDCGASSGGAPAGPQKIP